MKDLNCWAIVETYRSKTATLKICAVTQAKSVGRNLEMQCQTGGFFGIENSNSGEESLLLVACFTVAKILMYCK